MLKIFYCRIYAYHTIYVLIRLMFPVYTQRFVGSFFYNTAYLFCLLSVVMYTRSDWSRQTDIISQVLGFMALKCPDD